MQFLCQFFFLCFLFVCFSSWYESNYVTENIKLKKIYNIKNWKGKDKSLCQSLMDRECRWVTTLHNNRHWNVTYSSTTTTAAFVSNRKHLRFGGFEVLTWNHLECFSCAICSLSDLSFKDTVFLQDATVIEFSDGFVVVRQVYEFVN